MKLGLFHNECEIFCDPVVFLVPVTTSNAFDACDTVGTSVVDVPVINSASVDSSTNQLVVVVACISLAAFNSVRVVFLITPLAALSAIPILSAFTGVVFDVAVLICFLI